MNQQPYSNKFNQQSNAEVVFCPYCGTQNPAFSKFCYYCGQAIPQRTKPAPWYRRKSVILNGLGAAAVIALVILFLILRPDQMTIPGPFSEPATRVEPVQPQPQGNPGQDAAQPAGGQTTSGGSQPAEPRQPDGGNAPGGGSQPVEPQPPPSSGGAAPAGGSQPVEPQQPSGGGENEPGGKIVFNCTIESYQQVCMMNADGSEQEQLTHYAVAASTYPMLGPDGQSVIFTSNESGDHAIYEMDLSNRSATRLTDAGGDKAYPEMSPNGKKIAYSDVKDKKDVIYVMNRDGSHLREIYRGGLHPAWSPDGKQIAFLCIESGKVKVCVMNADGSDVRTVTDMPEIGQQVVWSPDGQELAFFAGPKGSRWISLIRPDGSGYRVIRQGYDSVSPSYSPDGEWLVFTEYRPDGKEKPGEIYIMRTDGSEARRLTTNDRTDWLPYWGK